MNACKHKNGYTVIGAFSSELTLAQQTILNSTGWGFFWARYNNLGLPISLEKIGRAELSAFGNYSNFRFGLAVDSAGNSFIGLNFKDSVEIGAIKLYGDSVFNALIFEIDNQGNFVWYKKIGGVAGAFLGYNQSLQINRDQTLLATLSVSDSTQLDGFWLENRRGLAVIFDSLGQTTWIGKAGKNNISGGLIGSEINGNDEKIVLGNFQTVNNILFDNINVMASNEYSSTVFNSIAKYDSSNVIQWVRHFGGATFGASFNANAVKSDSKGNVYVSGSCRCQSSLDQLKIPGGGLYNGFGDDVFVLKYDRYGNFCWFKRTGLTDEENWRGFDISDTDELLLTYVYSSTSWIDSHKVESMGGFDIALVKMDTSGQVTWMNSIGGMANEEAVSIVCSDTSVLLLGQSLSTPCHFNQSDYTTQAPGNLFLAKLNKYELWPTGHPELEKLAVTLFPNPVSGSAILNISQGEGYYSLRDMSGRELFRKSFDASRSQYLISTTGFLPGVYVLQVQSQYGQCSKRLVIE